MSSRLRRSWLLVAGGALLLALFSVGHLAPPLDREFPRPFDVDNESGDGARELGRELSGVNLIGNGDFEQWSEREVELNPGLPGAPSGVRGAFELPDGWALHHWYGAAVGRAELEERAARSGRSLEFAAAEAHSGARALDLGFGGTMGGLWFASELFEVEPGAPYVLSLWLRVEGVASGSAAHPYPCKILLRGFADQDRSSVRNVFAFQRVIKVSPQAHAGGWHELQWQLTMPLELRWATVQLKPLQEGPAFRVLVDDLSLRRLDRRADAWHFDASHGFATTRRDRVQASARGLELAPVRNLAVNGGFEKDADGDGVPDAWLLRRCASTDASAEPALGMSRERRAGAWGVELRAEGGEIELVSQQIMLTEPGDYTASLYFKSPPRSAAVPGGVASLTVRSMSDGRVLRRDAVQADGSWVRESIGFTVADSADQVGDTGAGVEVIVGFRGHGRAWVDELQLERSPQANHLVSVGAEFADRGEALSEIIAVGRAHRGRIAWRAELPAGRRLAIETRSGFTPYFDPHTWTPWSQPCPDPRGSELDLEITGVPLFLQWRARFERDDPEVLTAPLVDRGMRELATLDRWRYRRGGGERPPDDETARGWPSIAGLDGLSLPAVAGDRPEQVWYVTEIMVPAATAGAGPYLRLPFAPGLARETSTTVFVGGVELGRRSGGADAWFDLARLVAPGSPASVALKLNGPGCDRIRYLGMARLLADDPAADSALYRTPRLASVTVEVEGPRERSLAYGDVEITRLDNGELGPQLVPARFPTAEERASDPGDEELAALAREIVSGVPMEDEETQILRLRKQIFALCNSTGEPSAYELDSQLSSSSEILKLAAQDRITMYCSHHLKAFYDLATAVGIVVRPVTTGAMGRYFHWADNVAEYWSNDHGKWVMINTFWDQVFYRRGVPQSAADLMDAWFEDSWHEIIVASGGDLSNDFRYSAERAVGPTGWQHIPPHSHANSHGWVENVTVFSAPGEGPGITLIRSGIQPVFLARHLWTGTLPATTDAAALYAPINQARMRLHFADGRCRVSAEHNMPAFSHFEWRVGDGAWQRADAIPFSWQLVQGGNVLRLRAVNSFGRPGPESRVMLRVLQPDAVN